MTSPSRFHYYTAILVLAAASLLPSVATAQAQADEWEFQATLYGWFPSVSGDSIFPVDGGGSSINVDSDTLLDSLNGFFMGSLDAHYGSWGAFADFMYLDVGGSELNTRDFTIGNIGLPATTSADLGLDIQGSIWTFAGEYRVMSDPGLKVDLFAGARLLDVDEDLNWTISGSLGNITAGSSTGSLTASQNIWDGIIGVKGRYAFGAENNWFIPFYLDVGMGDSDLTWQAAIGAGYSFSWGDIHAMYRYLDYNFESGNIMQDLRFNGPMIGVSLRW